MLIRPIITEKTVAETKLGRFAFEVELGVNKTEVKQAIEKLFGVKVLGVQTVILPGKAYRTGKRWRYAYKPDRKKAVVTLSKGQNIDLFDVRPAEEPEVVGSGEKETVEKKPTPEVKKPKKGQK